MKCVGAQLHIKTNKLSNEETLTVAALAVYEGPQVESVEKAVSVCTRIRVRIVRFFVRARLRLILRFIEWVGKCNSYVRFMEWIPGCLEEARCTDR